jgi:hypothetical protein
LEISLTSFLQLNMNWYKLFKMESDIYYIFQIYYELYFQTAAAI